VNSTILDDIASGLLQRAVASCYTGNCHNSVGSFLQLARFLEKAEPITRKANESNY
jgi:hypothetical protein